MIGEIRFGFAEGTEICQKSGKRFATGNRDFVKLKVSVRKRLPGSRKSILCSRLCLKKALRYLYLAPTKSWYRRCALLCARRR